MGPLVPGGLCLVLDICVLMNHASSLRSFKKHCQVLPTEHSPQGQGQHDPTEPARVQADESAQHSGASAVPRGAEGGVLWWRLRDPVLTLGFQDLLETPVSSAAAILFSRSKPLIS